MSAVITTRTWSLASAVRVGLWFSRRAVVQSSGPNFALLGDQMSLPPWLGRLRLQAVIGAVLTVALSTLLLASAGPGPVLLLLTALGATAFVVLLKYQMDLARVLGRLDQRLAKVSDKASRIQQSISHTSTEVTSHGVQIRSIESRLKPVNEVAKGVMDIRGRLGTARRPSVDYRQLEAALGIYQLLDIEQRVPPMRGWSGSPDFLLELVSYVLARRPEFVLECGSGVSTLLVAYALRRNGTGHLHSLEHDAAFAHSTRDLLRLHGLAEWASVIHAPLKRVQLHGEDWRWYDPDALNSLDRIGIVVVDGPPSQTQPLSRYPVLPIVSSKLSPGAVVLLDDYRRDDEQAVVERWIQEYKGLRLQELDHEKGTAVLSW